MTEHDDLIKLTYNMGTPHSGPQRNWHGMSNAMLGELSQRVMDQSCHARKDLVLAICLSYIMSGSGISYVSFLDGKL